MNWLRRESATGNTRAVWFDVLAAESAYFEGGCCLPDADGKNWVRLQAGYREEIAIDAGSGTILCRKALITGSRLLRSIEWLWLAAPRALAESLN
jgi:glutamine amidotransferase-like uncharacterized protein